MARHQPFQVIGYHSCDREIGIDILNGKMPLNPSNNDWDWLGDGIYFWEQDPVRALEYAVNVARGKQHNKVKLKTPFVLGAMINLGHCLNLVASESITILKSAHDALVELYDILDIPLPVNKGAQRRLDCAVLRYVQSIQKAEGKIPYDTIRSAFVEGEPVYEGANFTRHHHIQVCVINESMIQGYFLQRPLEEFNPYLFKDFL